MKNEQTQPVSARRRHTERGFSLTELMIVVAIIGVLSGVGLAAMASGREERALRRATATLVGTFQDLRAVATSSGRSVVVNVTAGDIPTGQPGFVRWWFSADNTCTAITVADVRTLTFRARGDDRETRNVVITRLTPRRAGAGAADVSMCITPDGRVVDPTTSRPLPRSAGSAYDGQAYFELIPARCDETRCEPSAYVSTVSFGFSGLTEVMSPGYRIP
jgi:prepilin-type N-terminal cleavage/methylation domain-containing protein